MEFEKEALKRQLFAQMGGGIDGERQGGTDTGGVSIVMLAPEAEMLVDGLRCWGIEEVGSRPWMQQREAVEMLNLQAHHNVRSHSDEFVKNYLTSYDKVQVLVQELLTVEVWREKIFPLLGARVAESSIGSMNVYLACHYEASLINLLEITLFHREACEAAGDTALLELADYCNRKLVYLNGPAAAEDASYVERTAKELMELTPQHELHSKIREAHFGASLCALTVLRYLCDFVNDLPLCVMSNLLDTNDTIMLLVPLLSSRPWLRRRTRGGRPATEVFQEGKWEEQDPRDRLLLTKNDAQCWLALHTLLCDPKCRAKYRYDDYRKGVVAGLKRHFNEVLMDQLPVLSDVQRCVDELILMATPTSDQIKEARLILEQVPEIRDRLLKSNTDEGWKRIARSQTKTHFAETDENRRAAMERMEGLVKQFDILAQMEGEKNTLSQKPRKVKAEKLKPENLREAVAVLGSVKLESQIEGLDGQWRTWGKYEGCIHTASVEEVQMTSKVDGSQFEAVRWRLKPIETYGVRWPHQGRVLATFAGQESMSAFNLPTFTGLKSEVPDGSIACLEPADLVGKPATQWVSIGNIVDDRWAAQVRLQRHNELLDVMSNEGSYFLYAPAGGAVTISKSYLLQVYPEFYKKYVAARLTNDTSSEK